MLHCLEYGGIVLQVIILFFFFFAKNTTVKLGYAELITLPEIPLAQGHPWVSGVDSRVHHHEMAR